MLAFLALIAPSLAGFAAEADIGCSCTNLTDSFVSSAVIFIGSVSGTTATVQTTIRGLTSGVARFRINVGQCSLAAGETYLVHAARSGTSATITCAVAKSDVPLRHLYFLQSQSISGTTVRCVNNSTRPITCDRNSVCRPSNACPGRTCTVNPCGGCSPSFFERGNVPACLDVCPDGSRPLQCRADPCEGAIPPARCTGARCVANSCGGCSPVWVDDNGAVCSAVHLQCADRASVVFGAGVALGFAVQAGTCKAINGKRPSPVELFASLADCTSTCAACRDLSNVNTGTGSTVWFGVVGGRCQQIRGSAAVRDALKPSVYSTAAACQQACTVRPQPTQPSTPVREVPAPATAGRRACQRGTAGCCPDGLTAEVCLDANLKAFCDAVKCTGRAVPKNCTADPCNACRPTIRDAAGRVIPSSQCALNLPEYTICNPANPGNVTCPANSPRCPSTPPSGCPANWNARCINDPCSCKPVWMNEDLREPTPDCLQAFVAPCVPVKDCPKAYTCPALTEEQKKVTLPADTIWECIQQPCTCIPTQILAPKGGAFILGRKIPCGATDSDCCPDGNKPQNCATIAQNTQATCQNMVCTGPQGKITIASCAADPCNNCDAKATDSRGRVIDPASCTFGPSIGETCPFDDKVKCNVARPNCGRLPSTCPSDWKIDCVVDPCLCRPIWQDNDIRFTPTECTVATQPSCYTTPTQQCPVFQCPPIPQSVREQVPPSQIAALVCVQHQCDCKPTWLPRDQVRLIPGLRVVGGQTAAAPPRSGGRT